LKERDFLPSLKRWLPSNKVRVERNGYALKCNGFEDVVRLFNTSTLIGALLGQCYWLALHWMRFDHPKGMVESPSPLGEGFRVRSIATSRGLILERSEE